MAIATENNVTEYWKELVEQKQAEVGYPICGARNRQGTPCTNKAGKGTDHLGEGRCKNHGGGAQSPLAKNWKHGKYSKIKTQHPELRAKMEQLAGDHDVFDLREEILKIRAIMEIQAEQGEFLTVAKLAVDVSKIIERLHLIEEGRKYVISVENVSNIIETVKDIIMRHIPEADTRHLIAQELNAIRLSSARPSPKLIEGRAEVIDVEE